MTREDYIRFHTVFCEQMIEVTSRKNSDYATSADPFSNFEHIATLVDIPGIVEIGFLTRMSDKMSRIGSFVTKGELAVKTESVEDTLLDLANYCVLFAGYLKSKQIKEIT